MDNKTGAKEHLMENISCLRHAAGEHTASGRERDLLQLLRDGQRYQLMARTLKDIIWTMNAAGEFTYLSHSLIREAGYDPKELTETTLDHVFVPTSMGALRGIFDGLAERLTDQAMVTGSVELEGHHKDGSSMWFDVHYGARYLPDGELIVIGTARDITERKQAEAEREHLVSELRQALTEVKTLKGLLPICTNCKKVRDDRGYWNQIENYITEHSDTVFSHSICPECTHKLYPEFCDKK